MIRSVITYLFRTARWVFATAVVALFIHELIRVIAYVISEWGMAHAIVDGAVLHKIGEAAILLPFFVLVHWNGVWVTERALVFTRLSRWCIWVGGVLTLLAMPDLFGRVRWAWWTVALVVFALILPPVMSFLAGRRAVWRGYFVAALLLVLFLGHYAASYLMTGYFVAPLPASFPSAAETQSGKWQQDLLYLADNLPRLHVDAFHSVDSVEFAESVARFHDNIPNLTDQQIKVGFYRIAAMINDGHTAIDNWNTPSSGRYPIRYFWLSDGLFVVAVSEEHPDLLGARVLNLGDYSAGSVFDSVCTLLPHESDSYLLHRGVWYLVDMDVLQAFGIADTTGTLRLTVQTSSGDTLRTQLNCGSPVSLIRSPENDPFFKSRGEEEYWSEFFDDCRTAYLKYNTFANPVAFPRYTDEFWADVERWNTEYVIVDFRENGGGYSGCFDRFFEQILDHDHINRSGHLYVLTNRRTFSSASFYTAILKRETAALIAGEPMGGALNHHGDMRLFDLPNSRVTISYSVQYFELWPDSLPPFSLDVFIPMSSDEYFAAEDPVLDSVMTLIRADLASQDGSENGTQANR